MLRYKHKRTCVLKYSSGTTERGPWDFREKRIQRSVSGMELRIAPQMSVMEKLKILGDAAKYDVSCSSSGSSRKNDGQGIGNTVAAGLCHSFAADGRCISLLKILFTNECIYDCRYCMNRCSNDVPRASFTPDEVCELTMEFYRRNYIEGLFFTARTIRWN